jgi:tape measure domain-containing protein
MTDASIVIGVKSDGRGANIVKRDLDEIARKGDKATGQNDRFNSSLKRTDGLARSLKTAFAGLAASLSVGVLSRFSDSITELNTKLKNVAGSTKAANDVFDDLFDIAQRNGDSVNGLADAYSKLSIALPDTIKDTTDLTKVTELLSRGLAAAGANAQTANGTLLQLNQGLAGNFESSAQELNSLIEGAPLLAKVIAEELGGNSAVSLKRFAEAGELTADSFLKALIASEDAIKAFELPPTISRSITRVSNEFLRLGRESEVLRGFSGLLTTALDSLADNLDNIIRIIAILAGASLPLLIKQFAVLLPAAITATTTAFTALTAIIASNPIAAIAVAISAAISAFFLFRKEIFETLRDVDVFGVGVTDVFFGIKNTAIEVFKSLIDIIALPFRVIIESLKSFIAQIKILANKAPGINFDISQNDRYLANQSVAEIGLRLGKETFSRTGQTYQRVVGATKQDIIEFNKIAEDTGLVDTPNASTATPPLVKTVEEVGKKTKITSKEIDKTFNDFGDGIIDAFRRGFEGGDGILDRFLSGAKNAFQNLFADVTRLIAQPIVMNIGAAVTGGAIGAGASGGLSSLTGGATGGGGLGSLGSVASSLLNGGLYSSTLGNVGANIGANLFGGGQLLSKGAFVGSQALGNLGYGAIGGGLANILGLGGGIGGTIGGTLGSVAGGGIGASMGTILGFAGGPVGAIVGSFLGTALGGLFGGKKPSDKAQNTAIDLDTGRISQGGLTGDKFSQENRDFADQVIAEAEKLTNLLKSAGAEFDSGVVSAIVGNRDGLRVQTQNGIQNFGTNTDAFIKGVSSAVVSQISDAPDDLETVLKNVSGFDTQEVAEAVGILELIRSFEKAGDASKPLRDALDALDVQFAELKEKTIGLGLPVDQLTESYEKQKDAIIKDVLSPLQNFLDSQALSGSSSLNPIERLGFARSAFDENLLAIQAGDFDGLGNITNQANTLLGLGRDAFASGEGFASLESYVRQSIAGIAGDLGVEGALDTSVNREIAIGQAQQTSILQQMNANIEALLEENRRLRKANERVGNAMVVQS